MNDNRDILESEHEVRKNARWLSDHFNVFETGENFLPKDPKLHFSDAVAHAAVNAEPE